MTRLRFMYAATILAAIAVAPGLAQARTHHHHRYPYSLAYEISYLHNYGPGLTPGTFAYCDGPSNNLCYQGSVAYLGQDHRRHLCF